MFQWNVVLASSYLPIVEIFGFKNEMISWKSTLDFVTVVDFDIYH